MNENIFERLFAVIESRKGEDIEKSYVARLMSKGERKINEKILEEASEVAEAALGNDKDHLVYEICDLLFHTFVMAGYKDITLDQIAQELERRFGKSGLVEKAERANKE